MRLFLNHLASPLGDMLLVIDSEQRVRALDFADHRAHLHRLLREHYGHYELVDAPVAGLIEPKLRAYLAGAFDALDDVATATNGSDLQRQVWTALRAIPAGEVATYGELARELGYDDPRMAKEIGAAVGANPVAIVVPCHRVIGAHGDLKGYAWGLHRKKWLLEHERAKVRREPAQPELSL
jgi:methylated-DNA-[protein]-cysteine S-methyltransferase